MTFVSRPAEREAIVRRTLILLCLAIPRAPTTAAGARESSAAARKAERVHAAIWRRFVDPATFIVRTRVAPPGAHWAPALEDTSLSGGMYLAAMVDRYDVLKSPAAADDARKLFLGLLRNATCAEPGFIARGVWPDGKGFRGAPSVDQYTGLLYGLWRYYESGLASPEDKARIRRVFADCLKRLERHGFVIVDADGKTPTRYGRLDAVRPTRSERLLSFLLAGWRLTGDRHWREVYERMKEPRLESCRRFDRMPAWVLVQSAMSLHMLLSLETRPRERRAYAQGMASCVEGSLRQIPAYRGAGSKVKTFRNPIEGIAVVLLSGDADAAARVMPALREILGRVEPEKETNSVPLCSLEWDYWMAVKRGLSPRPR